MRNWLKQAIYLFNSIMAAMFFCGCSSIKLKPTNGPPVVLGESYFQFNQHGRTGHLSLIWVGGKHIHDGEEETWCGQGEKYEGKFMFRVEISNVANQSSIVDTSLESLYPNGRAFDFIPASESQPWKIELADFNNDDQPDFNIVSYRGCRFSSCWFFTITASGKVEVLKTDADSNELVVPLASEHSLPSTAWWQMTPNGFVYEDFDRDTQMAILIFFDWEKEKKAFHRREQKIKVREQEPGINPTWSDGLNIRE